MYSARQNLFDAREVESMLSAAKFLHRRPVTRLGMYRRPRSLSAAITMYCRYLVGSMYEYATYTYAYLPR